MAKDTVAVFERGERESEGRRGMDVKTQKKLTVERETGRIPGICCISAGRSAGSTFDCRAMSSFLPALRLRSRFLPAVNGRNVTISSDGILYLLCHKHIAHSTSTTISSGTQRTPTPFPTSD